MLVTRPELANAVDQRRHAIARQQHRQQRHQVRLLACAVVARIPPRVCRPGGQRRAVIVRGFQHAGQFVRCLALDAIGQQHGAQLEIGNTTGEHGIEQRLGVFARQRAAPLTPRPISLMYLAAGNGARDAEVMMLRGSWGWGS
jgi:hypothetical protein